VVTLLVLLAGAAIVVKASQNEDRRARIAERNRKIESIEALGWEVTARVQMAFRQDMSIDEFEEEFGPLSPLTGRSERGLEDKTHIYVHEPSQRGFHLRFEDGVLMGFEFSQGSDDIDPGVVLETRGYLVGESIRKGILSWALFAWLVALVVGIARPRFRPHVARILLVVAAICAACWFLDPGYSPTWEGVASDDNLVWASILLILSIGSGLLSWNRPSSA
jgi:hypothetical protein